MRIGLHAPAPFTLIEMEEDDLPERPYTKAELLAYLAYGRRKCQATIEALPDETAQRRCRFAWGKSVSWSYNFTVCATFRNMRHS